MLRRRGAGFFAGVLARFAGRLVGRFGVFFVARFGVLVMIVRIATPS
jgi:hypothetical protein